MFVACHAFYRWIYRYSLYVIIVEIVDQFLSAKLNRAFHSD